MEILKAFVPPPNLTSLDLIFTFPFPPTTPAPFSWPLHLPTWPSLEPAWEKHTPQSELHSLQAGPRPRDFSPKRLKPGEYPVPTTTGLAGAEVGLGASHSRVIHETWVRHLLEVNSHRNLRLDLTPRDPLFNHVLQIGKPSPDVSEIFHRISSGTRIPVPIEKMEEGMKDGKGKRQLIHTSQAQGDSELTLLKPFP